jgi:hypothetical protein
VIPSLSEILENPELRAVEIARLRKEEATSRREGCFLDADAYASALQVFTDAESGIKRCYACGKVKRKLPRIRNEM